MGSGASNVKIEQSPSPTNSESASSLVSSFKEEKKAQPLKKEGDRLGVKNGVAKLPSSDKRESAHNVFRGFDDSNGILPPISKSSGTQNTKSTVRPLSASKLKAVSFDKAEGGDRTKLLEQEFANSESQKLDLQEQCQLLQERILILEQRGSDNIGQGDAKLSETIHAKDQYIVKLEKDLKNLQTESNTTRLKLKKRIKGLTNQLHEVRQESSIRQMELKEEIAQKEEKIKFLSSTSSPSPSGANEDKSSHSKLIVELSNQLAEQEDKIASLEAEVVEKDLTIAKLQSQLKETDKNNSQKLKTDETSELPSGDRLHSSRGARSTSNAPAVRFGTAENKMSDRTLTPLTRQSTALSDSDSDWEVSELASQTHSAPARVRVKSAQSVQSVSKQASVAGSVQGDDDSVMQYLNNPDLDGTSKRVRAHKKSALKNHLEKQKVENQLGSLMGPSLAFASQTKEPVSDTSCEPTPRNYDPSKLPGFSKLTVINQVQY